MVKHFQVNDHEIDTMVYDKQDVGIWIFINIVEKVVILMDHLDVVLDCIEEDDLELIRMVMETDIEEENMMVIRNRNDGVVIKEVLNSGIDVSVIF